MYAILTAAKFSLWFRAPRFVREIQSQTLDRHDGFSRRLAGCHDRDTEQSHAGYHDDLGQQVFWLA